MTGGPSFGAQHLYSARNGRKNDYGFNHKALWVSNKDKSSSNQPAEPDDM